ncbi:MAG: acyl-CoA dehydrogenase, partial [bacterium]|nr:acyl-CoA dehydrogenase [bacterium]
KKTFVVNGEMAGFYVVLCQTDTAIEPSVKGISMILVDADQEGLSANRRGDRLGINMMATADLDFKNVRVPLSHLIGTAGKGYDNLQKFYDETRILIAAQAVGTAQGAFDRARAYIKEREQFNRPIAAFQTVRHKIADMATNIEFARLLTYQAAKTFDQGKKDAKSAAMAKLTATRT